MHRHYRGRRPVWPRLVLPFILVSASLGTWNQPAVAQDNQSELDALRQEVSELRRLDEERQRKLDELQRKLESLPSSPVVPAATQPAAGQSALDRAVGELPASPSPRGETSAAADVLRDAAGRDIFSTRAGGTNFRLMDASLNVLAAGGGSTVNDSELQNLQGGGHDPRKNGFTVQNVELSLAGAVDPYFTAEAHLIYFIDPIEGESVFELEEAFLTTQRLPSGLQLEAGQFFTEFGRLNPRHPHQWEWMDQPVINTRLFGPDGMRGPGVRLGWLTPLPWFSEFHFGVQNANGETMASFLSSDEAFEERPVGGRQFEERDGNAFNSLVYLLRWENGFELGNEWSSAVGASALFGPNATGGSTAIYGTDIVFKWRPERNQRGWPNFLWQTEVMYRDYQADDATDGEGATIAGGDLEDWGFYSQALYGFTPGWRSGVRFEYASGSGDGTASREDDPFGDDRFRVSPLIEWLPSEFSRIRFQVNYDEAEHLEEDEALSFWLGFEYLIGSHGAHRY